MNRGLKQRPEPGTRVRLTGYFLACTGQQAGGEGQKRFTMQECHCESCEPKRAYSDRSIFVAVDEPVDQSYYADLPPGKRPRWRHINAGNLEIIGAPPKAGDYP